ncbi:unnamed protein product [Caenorhabditis nigoni]
MSSTIATDCPQTAEAAAEIQRRVQMLRERHSTAFEAHQKTEDSLKKLQQKYMKNNANIESLTNLLDCESCPQQKEILKKCIRKQKTARTKILKNEKEVLKVAKRTRYVMEEAKATWWSEAQAMWNFQVMCANAGNGDIWQSNWTF